MKFFLNMANILCDIFLISSIAIIEVRPVVGAVGDSYLERAR